MMAHRSPAARKPNRLSPLFIGGLVLAAAMGVVLVMLGTAPFGVGYSADSVAYVTTAQSLRSGNGFFCWDGRPYVDWPPLYPAVLAAVFELEPNPGEAVRWLHAFIFGAIIVTTVLLLRNGFVLRASLWICCAATVLSFPLLTIHVMVLSEPLFVLLVLAGLAALLRYLRDESRLSLTLLGVLSALAALQRMAGVALMLAAALLILFARAQKTRGQRLLRILAYAGLALVPLMIWAWRNLSVHGTMAGHRATSLSSPVSLLMQLADGMSAWIVPRPWPMIIRGLVWVGLAALVIGLSLRKNDAAGTETVAAGRIWNVMLVWVVVYCAFMVAVSLVTTTRSEALTLRLITPIYVPVVYLFVRSLEKLTLLPSARSSVSRFRKRVFIAIISLWALYPAAMSAHHISQWRAAGVCPYRQPRWMQSETIQWIQDHPLPPPVLSNHPEALYVRLGQEAALTPMIADSPSVVMRHFGSHKTAYLVWFPDMLRGRNFQALDDLARDFIIEPVVVLKDGSVYRMSVRPR